MRTILLDIATSALPNAADFIDLESVAAPANYKDQAKIDAYKAEKVAERLAAAVVDLDLARITGVAVWDTKEPQPFVQMASGEDEERNVLTSVASYLTSDLPIKLTAEEYEAAWQKFNTRN